MNLREFLEDKDEDRESMQPYLIEFYEVYKEYQKQKGSKASCIDYFMARKFLLDCLEKHHNFVLSEVKNSLPLELEEYKNEERNEGFNRCLKEISTIIDQLRLK